MNNQPSPLFNTAQDPLSSPHLLSLLLVVVVVFDVVVLCCQVDVLALDGSTATNVYTLRPRILLEKNSIMRALSEDRLVSVLSSKVSTSTSLRPNINMPQHDKTTMTNNNSTTTKTNDNKDKQQQRHDNNKPQ